MVRRLFEATIEYEAEQRQRDEFGWIDGHGPGNGNYRPVRQVVRVVAQDEKYVRAYVLATYTGDGVRNIRIVNIENKHIDAIIRIER